MAKGNCTKGADGKIVYKTVSKTGSAPAQLDSSKWYMDKCEITGYRSEHLTIKVNEDGIIRVDGDYKDGKASRSFFKEYIIPDGVDYEALEFRIYESDANTLVIVGAIGGSEGGEMVSAQHQQQIETSSTIKRTENVRISSTFTETFESTELEGSEDMSRDVRVVDNKFEAKVNVSEYKNEEVHVKISKKVVLIYTSRREVTKTSSRQEIKKTFEIPAGVKPESITSVVGQDGNLTVSAPVDKELVRQQQVQENTKKSVTTTTSADEVVIRIRTVNTTKNVTGQDLKDVKIVNDRFEMNVDLREYELNEVTVKIIKTRRVITISANHKSQFESRSAYREFTLPAGAPDSNPNAIDAVLSPNGILTITGPCTPQTTPAALTDITDDITNKVLKQQNTTVQQQQQQNTTVQQQQQNQNTSVQQHHQKNTSVQQLQDTQVQSEQQIVQKSRYTKITRETFTSSTMTSLDISDANDSDEPIISQPDTPIEDVTVDMGVDEDGNYITEVNIKDFRAEEITIKASKAVITIVGRKNDENREFVKTIRVPIDVVVTPDKIRSILDKARCVLTIIITKNKTTTTTTTKQITDNTTEDQTINDQKRVDSLQQQRQQVQQNRETVQETQTKVQTQQVNQQKQVQKKQESIEETEVQTQQQINQQKQVQQNRETIQDNRTQVNTQKQQINQQKQDQTTQQVRQQDQRQQNTTNTTTTSKRTIKTTTTTVESLQKLGYNFDSATSQEYKGDPKFFERATPVVDYKPEDLEVKIAMPWVIVEGKQEMTAENGWRSKQFTKMFTVPQGVKEENIRLEWNDAGDVVNCTALIG